MRLLRLPLALAVLATALAAATITPARAQIGPPGGWYIDVDSVLVEDALAAEGDDIAIAVVGFRTRLGGGAQYTDVWLQRPFQRVCTDARAGTRCPVPDEIGAVRFGTVYRPSLADIAASGHNGPEIVGTVQYLTDDQHYENLTQHLPLAELRYVLTYGSAAVATDRLTSGVAIGVTAVDLLRHVETVANGSYTLPAFITATVGVASDLRDTVNLGILARQPTTLLQTAAAALEYRQITATHGDQNLRYVTNETVHLKP